ncbi:MAG: FecR domain-containing protein [Bacteroidales bacterium]
MKTIQRTADIDTDQAWTRLRARLEQEGLVPEQQPPQSFSFSPWMKYAASFLVLVLTATMLYLNRGGQSPNAEYLALTTGSEDLTLVKTLGDGSVIYLAAHTSFSYPEQFNASERRVKVRGEAFFEVTPDAEHPFRVEAGNALIEVVGTSFNVKTTGEDEVEVFVEEGLVKVNVGTDQLDTVMVGAGEVLHMKKSSYYKTSGDLLIALWRQNRMHFKDEPLSDILQVINRNYNGRLQVQDPAVGSRQLTVTFFNNSLPTIIELLCLSLNLETHTQPDSSVVLVSKK